MRSAGYIRQLAGKLIRRICLHCSRDLEMNITDIDIEDLGLDEFDDAN